MYQKIKKWNMIAASLLMLLSNFFASNTGHAQSSEQVFFRDGVVINNERNEMYVANKEATVEALDLASGKQLWKTEIKGKPLFYAKDRLFVQLQSNKSKSELILLAVNLNNGKAENEISARLPDNVKCHIVNSASGSFFVNAYIIDNEIALVWHYKPPPRGAILANDSYKSEKGVLLFNGNNLQTIKFSDLPKSYDQNSIVPKRKVIKSEKEGYEFLSKNGNHVLVSRMFKEPKVIQNYGWRIYERGSKELLGQLDNNVSYAPFVVIGNKVIFEQSAYKLFDKKKVSSIPLQLIWFDLKINKIVFEKEILDTSYQGPILP